ncbi:Protein transport protein S9 plasma membrane t-SNARE [Basidiobolus ranarum]|uniref:Protein transport protein S9 plasma membrane t-SNARE n=1 Tax=Basidiobolus ranarum TaxID=34480 RepID=A0ABR2VXF8_9FUNG
MEEFRRFRQQQQPQVSNELGYTPSGDVDEDSEVLALRQEINRTRDESLASTQNAIRALKQTEDRAQDTLVKLGEQSESINSIRGQLDIADTQADLAAQKTAELKKINGSIFKISFSNPFGSKKKKEKELARLQAEHTLQQERKEELRKFDLETKQRVAPATGNRHGARHGYPGPGNSGNPTFGAPSAYTFEGEGEEQERQIDENLGIMSDSLLRLKNMGLNMREEIDLQNQVLDTINQRADEVDQKIHTNQYRLDKIK